MSRWTYLILLVCLPLTLNGCSLPQKRSVEAVDPSLSRQERPAKTKRGEEVAIRPHEEGRESGMIQSERLPAASVVGVGPYLPSAEEVAARIAAYNNKLERWRQRDSQAAVTRMSVDESEKMVQCFQELQRVLNGYNRLHELLVVQPSLPGSRPTATITTKEILDLQRSDIAFVDGICGQMVGVEEMSSAGWIPGEREDGLASMEAAMAQYAAMGQDEELVRTWRQIPDAATARLRLDTRIFAAKALIAMQQEEEAAGVLRRIVDQAVLPDGQSAELLVVRKMLADLHVALGRYPDAEVNYLEILKIYGELGRIEEWSVLQLAILKKNDRNDPELRDYADLLKKYLAFNPAKDGYIIVWQADSFLQKYPYSPVASNVDRLRNSSRELADRWFKNAATGAAVPAVQAQPDQAEPSSSGSVLGAVVSPEPQGARGSVGQAEMIQSVEPVRSEGAGAIDPQVMEGIWNEGIVFMEGAQYDQAIEKFRLLLGGEYSAKAEKKIAEASLLAAEEERRKAADIFIRFTKASDTESKKKLLIEARSRLLSILKKYPGVEIREKILGNIKRVEKEMDAIDPTLLRHPGRIDG